MSVCLFSANKIFITSLWTCDEFFCITIVPNKAVHLQNIQYDYKKFSFRGASLVLVEVISYLALNIFCRLILFVVLKIFMNIRNR
jgi:hypothetical protein